MTAAALARAVLTLAAAWLLAAPALAQPVSLSMPTLDREFIIEGAALALGLVLLLSGLGSLGRSGGATQSPPGQPSIVEAPTRRPPTWLLAPIGLALAAWAGSRLWPRLPDLRHSLPSDIRLPAFEFSGFDLNFSFLWMMALVYAAGIGSVNLVRRRLRSLRRSQQVGVPQWAQEGGRIRFWPAVTWIWTADGPDFHGDQVLKALVGIARIGVLAAGAAVALAVLSVVL